MKVILCICIVIVFYWSSSAFAGKKHCQSYLAKLDNIKSQQRQGNSLKRSNSLAKKETKARKIWWDCETGKTKTKKRKSKKTKHTKSVKKNKIATSTNQSTGKSNRPIIPFKTSNSIVVKSKYHGKKLAAWLVFYKQKKECQRPSSIQAFAACVEDKQRQHVVFERDYVPMP